jgi:SAM-dependent methyltransferase
MPDSLLAPLARAIGWNSFAPRPGSIMFGSLRRTEPVSRNWGWDRGLPVDRWYIERFLREHQSDIRGRVLEPGDNRYTLRFGGSHVTQADVLFPTAGEPGATVIGDLADGIGLPESTFDCIVLVQTLQFIYDARSAMRTLHRMLRPGGVLLLTAPGISHIGDDTWHESWNWMFTQFSLRRMAEEHFGADAVEVNAHGNVLAATAFLQGLASDELSDEELTRADPSFPVVLTLRARRPGRA